MLRVGLGKVAYCSRSSSFVSGTTSSESCCMSGGEKSADRGEDVWRDRHG